MYRVTHFFAAVTVVLQPSNSMAIVRGTFSFNCTAHEIAEIQEFKWFHNQTEITSEVIQQRNVRFNIRSSGSVSSILSVTSAERQDGGEYYCQAFISGNTNPVNSSRHIIKIRGIINMNRH